MRDILKKTWDQGFWTWYCPEKQKTLIWQWQPQSLSATCEAQVNNRMGVKVAKFTPASQLRREGNPVVLSQLEVLPEGQEDFDDILISVLIIQRAKLTLALG